MLQSSTQGAGMLISKCTCLCMALQQRCHTLLNDANTSLIHMLPLQIAGLSFSLWLHSGEAAEMLAHFDQAVSGGAEGIEDDDEVQVDRGANLAPNAACPITSKGVRHRLTLPHRMLQHKVAICGAAMPMSTAFVVWTLSRHLGKHASATLIAVSCSSWFEPYNQPLWDACADPGDRGASAGSEGFRVRERCHCQSHPQERRGERSQLPASW